MSLAILSSVNAFQTETSGSKVDIVAIDDIYADAYTHRAIILNGLWEESWKKQTSCAYRRVAMEYLFAKMAIFDDPATTLWYKGWFFPDSVTFQMEFDDDVEGMHIRVMKGSSVCLLEGWILEHEGGLRLWEKEEEEVL